MNLPLYIAKRYFFSKSVSNAVNIISLISLLGIAAGTFALVTVMCAFSGIQELVEGVVSKFDADLKLTPSEGKTFNWQSIPKEKLYAIEGVTAIAPEVEELAGVKYGEQQAIVRVKGVDETFIKQTGLDSLMYTGNAELESDGYYFAAVGYGLSLQLGLFIEDFSSPLTLIVPKPGTGAIINPDAAFNRQQIYPSGIFMIGPDLDNNYVLLPLKFAQHLLSIGEEVSQIDIWLKPDANIEDVKEKIKSTVGEDFVISSKYEKNALIYKTNKIEKWITFLILTFILIIATFNLLSSLTMLLLEKKKDILILEQIGLSRKEVRRIFIWQGRMINLVGAIIGFCLGLILVVLQQKIGIVPLEGGIVPYYPVKIVAEDLLLILALVLSIGFLASYIPVRAVLKD